MADIAVDALRIRPVRFHRDNIESMIADQVARDGSPRPVEFAGAMGCLTEQHQIRIAKPPEGRAKTLGMLRRRQVFGRKRKRV